MPSLAPSHKGTIPDDVREDELPIIEMNPDWPNESDVPSMIFHEDAEMLSPKEIASLAKAALKDEGAGMHDGGGANVAADGANSDDDDEEQEEEEGDNKPWRYFQYFVIFSFSQGECSFRLCSLETISELDSSGDYDPIYCVGVPRTATAISQASLGGRVQAEKVRREEEAAGREEEAARKVAEEAEEKARVRGEENTRRSAEGLPSVEEEEEATAKQDAIDSEAAEARKVARRATIEANREAARVAALHRPAPSRTTRHTGHMSMDGVNKDEDDAAADASEAAAMDEDEDDAKKGAEEVGAGAAGTEAPKSEEEKDETAAAETATAAAAEAAGSKVEKTEKSLKRISWEDPNAIVIQLGNIDDWVVEYDKASRTAWCCLHTAEAW
jgi:hypothetical protein